MKKGIHPEVKDCTVTCACGETFTCKSTKGISKWLLILRSLNAVRLVFMETILLPFAARKTGITLDVSLITANTASFIRASMN